MKVLEYYFKVEFQWLDNWFSKAGVCHAIVNPSQEFIINNQYIDYNIIGRLFMGNEFQRYESYKLWLEGINSKFSKDNYIEFGQNGLVVEMNSEFSKLIDTIGDNIGIEAPLNWNITTPIQNQFIPTSEILQILLHWEKFLATVETCKLNCE